MFAYSLLLIFVWGYSIGFYYSELQFPLKDSGLKEEHAGTGSEINPLSWKSTDLLKEDQEFLYYIELPKKSITLSYKVIREMRAGFLVKGNAKSYSYEKGSGIILTIRELLTEENFFIIKDTGAPKTVTYTSSFWNTGLCHPLKTYFFNSPLLIDSSWSVSLPDNANAHVTVVDKKQRLDSECFICIIDEKNVKNELTICKGLPTAAEFQGEWCRGDDMKMVLEEYVG
jgi:hypothetical protein